METKIISCARTASGLFIINGGRRGNGFEINASEMRRLLLGLGLSALTPPAVLIGSKLVHETVKITDEMIIAGTNSVPTVNTYTNRTTGEVVDKITYKTPGTKYYDFQLVLADKIVNGLLAESVKEASREAREFAESQRLLNSNKAKVSNVEDDADENEQQPPTPSTPNKTDEELLAEMEAEELAQLDAQNSTEE